MIPSTTRRHHRKINGKRGPHDPRRAVFQGCCVEVDGGGKGEKARGKAPAPVKRLTLALRGRYRRIEPYGGNRTVPDDQLFFLGGISDVRGFDENMLRFDAREDPLGGRTSLLGSLEARIDLGAGFELTAFCDTGSIRGTEGDSDETGDGDGFRSSAGLGIRYITPIGPVGFLYGWNLDRKAEESSGRLHFTIGYSF